MPTNLHPYLCRVCETPIDYSGRGRVPTTCSPECRLAARAEDTRARRNGRPTPPTVEPLTRAEVDRIREQLRESAAERADAYDDRLDGLAVPADLFGVHGDEGCSPTLGELGFAVVRPARDGRTVWDSDAAQHRQAGYASRESQRIREECIRDAIRDALSDARAVGVFDPDEVDLEPARIRGNSRADAILAALM